MGKFKEQMEMLSATASHGANVEGRRIFLQYYSTYKLLVGILMIMSMFVFLATDQGTQAWFMFCIIFLSQQINRVWNHLQAVEELKELDKKKPEEDTGEAE